MGYAGGQNGTKYATSSTLSPEAGGNGTPTDHHAAILVVDDDQSMLDLFSANLVRAGYEIIPALNHTECFKALKDYHALDAVLLDVMLPEISGLDILKHINKLPDPPPVVMVTASDEVQNAIKALKLGAFDYLQKSTDITNITKFLRVMRNAVNAGRSRREVIRLQQELMENNGLGNIIGDSSGMRSVFAQIRQVAQSDVTVLVLGASGTGKELAAKAIHYNSSRRNGPFVPVNCAAIPATLIESELFGHEKGSFTGATARKPGKFEIAREGTIFLDEIGDMDHNSQAKLLRVLQDGSYERVGGTQPLAADVRVIAATNKNLRQLVSDGNFREDLYYRLDVFPIRMPTLTERMDDVPLLAAHFLYRFNGELEKNVTGFHPSVMNTLTQHTWPGNVRELENVVHRAVIAAPSNEDVQLSHLPPDLAELGASQIHVRKDFVSVEDPVENRIRPLKDVEKDVIQRALRKTSGNFAKAAQELQIGRATLYRKVKEYSLDVPNR